MVQLAWRFHWFKERLVRDPESKNYADLALTPDTEEVVEELEILEPRTSAKQHLVSIAS